MQGRDLAVVIMAAGKGTRMNNPDVAKVMYTVQGKPMVEHVVTVALASGAHSVVVVVGWQKDSVIDHLARTAPMAVCVEQNPQLGTGHAVMQAERILRGFGGDVLVLSGDVPLLRPETVRALLDLHRTTGAEATVLTAVLDDPAGYGRILRARDGSVAAIVEHKDATKEERRVGEINSGIYVFRAASLFEGLRGLRPDNVQKEYYLTDVIRFLRSEGLMVSGVPVGDPREILGVNTPAQLEEIRELMALRQG